MEDHKQDIGEDKPKNILCLFWKGTESQDITMKNWRCSPPFLYFFSHFYSA